MTPQTPFFLPHEEVAPLRPALATTRFAGLYVTGSLEGLRAPCAAVVGSRAPSTAGRALARHLGAALGRAGVCVISGLALGIDGAAHLGAVEAGSPTIGVLGGGHARFYPRGNETLAERMLAAGGAVLSPFPPEFPARSEHFLQRNAVIAALADAVIVVEAARRSGSLNTAGWAADLGIPVFAFPGDVDRPKVAGCLALIRDGATLVRDADDVLEGMGLPRTEAASAPSCGLGSGPGNRTSLEKALLARLREGEAALDDLLVRYPRKAAEVTASLVQLEFKGLVERRPGGRFATTDTNA